MLPEHAGEVLVERAAREHAAHRRLPRVPVRVDEARASRASGASITSASPASSFGPISTIFPSSTRMSRVRQLADVRIHRHDKTAPDDQTLAHKFPPVLREAFINGVQRD